MFRYLNILSDYIVYKLLALPPSGNLAVGLHFFIYNTLKVYILIIIIGFFIGVIRGYITPTKARKILSKASTGTGNIIAALLGILTPIESFSVVPVFIGFLGSGIPLSIAFTYLITAPITNEVAFTLFWGLFGYKAAFMYYGAGIIVGLFGGILIGALKMDKYVEPFVYEDGTKELQNHAHESFKEMLISAGVSSMTFLKNFWLYILIGVGLAAIVHGYVPTELLTKYVGINNPFAIPLAVLLVTFFYLNIAIAMPLIMVLANNGLPLGTILAFTMAVTATSIPELLILKKALKFPLLLTYFIVLILSIIGMGFVINFVVGY